MNIYFRYVTVPLIVGGIIISTIDFSKESQVGKSKLYLSNPEYETKAEHTENQQYRMHQEGSPIAGRQVSAMGIDSYARNY